MTDQEGVRHDYGLLQLIGVVLVALFLLLGCANHQPPQAPSLNVMQLPPCSMFTGEVWLPDPCRMEVTKGEWLRVQTPRPKPEPKRPWWLVGLLVLL